jgi:hypothetical protein
MRHAWFLRFAIVSAGLGVLVAMLGAGLIVSRQKTEQDALDRVLSTTASEKAALVDTELERLRALALLTARIPPFAELYAGEGSQAAKIAAVAGPGREINEALAYVDVGGAETPGSGAASRLPAPAWTAMCEPGRRSRRACEHPLSGVDQPTDPVGTRWGLGGCRDDTGDCRRQATRVRAAGTRHVSIGFRVVRRRGRRHQDQCGRRGR